MVRAREEKSDLELTIVSIGSLRTLYGGFVGRGWGSLLKESLVGR